QRQPHSQSLVQQTLDRLSQSDAGVAASQNGFFGDSSGELTCTRHEFLARQNLGDRTVLHGLLRAQLLTGQQKISAAGGPDNVRPDNVRPITRYDARHEVWGVLKQRGFGCENDIAEYR